MKYAIVENGGKQFKVVEGEAIEVDRMPAEVGDKVGLKRVLLMVDGDNVTIGTPTIKGVQVSATVAEHFKGPKIIIFKYSPRKRIRVKGGHRQQYTRLIVNTIGKPGESKKVDKAEAPASKKSEAKVEKKVTAKKVSTKAVSKVKKTEKAPATKTKKSTEKKTATKKETTKKATKKTTPKKTSSTKKS